MMVQLAIDRGTIEELAIFPMLVETWIGRWKIYCVIKRVEMVIRVTVLCFAMQVDAPTRDQMKLYFCALKI